MGMYAVIGIRDSEIVCVSYLYKLKRNARRRALFLMLTGCDEVIVRTIIGNGSEEIYLSVDSIVNALYSDN